MYNWIVHKQSNQYLAQTDFVPIEVLPNVQIGTAGTTTREEIFEKQKITHNLVVQQWDIENRDILKKHNVDYKKICVEDGDEGQVSSFWDDAFEYIEQVLVKNKENTNLKFEKIDSKNRQSSVGLASHKTIIENLTDTEMKELTQYKHKNLRDKPSDSGGLMMCQAQQPAEFDDETGLFQSLNRDRNRILINCIHGHSRSASVVIQQLMRKQKLKLTEAQHFINDSRYIWPKQKIMYKLKELQKKLDESTDEQKLDVEFDKLALLIQDQKKRIAGRQYKIK